MQYLRYTLIVCVMALFALFPTSAQEDVTAWFDEGDVLFYVTQDDALMIYNPRTRIEEKLLENVQAFSPNPDGRIAYTRTDETDTSLYLWDLTRPNDEPLVLTTNGHSMGWSPDNQHLAFVSQQDGYKTVHLWDGETTIDVTPADLFLEDDRFYISWHQGSRQLALISYYTPSNTFLYVWDGENLLDAMPEEEEDINDVYASWSPAGYLAITVTYGWSSNDKPAEIYLWDGDTTRNLSQNPNGRDTVMGWSPDGKLLFTWSRDETGFYIWDGVSFKEGLPDVDTFTPVLLEARTYMSNWVDSSTISLAIAQEDTSDKHQIVLWDVETQSIINQYTVSSGYAHNRMANDGQWIISSQLASGIPSIYLEIEDLDGNILFSEHIGESAFSNDGYFAYCGITDEGHNRLLSLWDGEESWIIAETSYKPARWLSGSRSFSCNHG